jgi:hypothetical protein
MKREERKVESLVRGLYSIPSPSTLHPLEKEKTSN